MTKITIPVTTAQTVTVPISDLLRDHQFQIRHKLDLGVVARYTSVIRSGIAMPPVKVAMLKGMPVLVDGWHRVAALEKAEQHTVEAEIIEVESVDEARFLAGCANLEHGLRLKGPEVKETFRAYIRAGLYRGRTLRQMAEDTCQGAMAQSVT